MSHVTCAKLLVAELIRACSLQPSSPTVHAAMDDLTEGDSQDQAGWDPAGSFWDALLPLIEWAPVDPQPGPETVKLRYKFMLSSPGHAHRTMLLGVKTNGNGSSPGRSLVQFAGGLWHGGWRQDKDNGELEILWEENAHLGQCTPVTFEPQVYRPIPRTSSFSRESKGKLEVLTLYE